MKKRFAFLVLVVVCDTIFLPNPVHGQGAANQSTIKTMVSGPNLAVQTGRQLRKRFSAQEAMMNNSPVTTAMFAEEVPLGEWGGEHIRLELTAGGGEVEFDCAHGTLAHKPVLDKNGRFEVSGTFVPERSGPVREDAQPRGIAVSYSGIVKNKQMTLSVKRSDNHEDLGSFTLAHGQRARLFKCR